MSKRLAAVGGGVLALGLGACGGRAEEPKRGLPVEGQQRGGTLRVLANSDVDHIDPGQAYYQFTYEITYATQRPLYSYRPDDPRTPVADLAAGPPQISADGKTVTVKVRRNVRFSPPVNRVVTSRDVKYALERGFLPSVANGYSPSYFGDLQGRDAFEQRRAPEIAGLQTPDDSTLVMRFDRPTGPTAAKALVLPASAPVPVEYARRFDRGSTSTYGMHQVATGPYMIANDAKGRLTGYRPGRSITLVRNPSWDGKAQGDYRPAYVDRIEFTIGADPNVFGRQVLAGRNLINGDTIPGGIVKLAARRHRDQITFTPLGNRYIALNTSVPPFDDVNVRRAVVAAMDRTRLQLTRGGRAVGDIATHFVPPGAPGFEAAGGMQGPELDFLAEPRGDPTLARAYLRKAGYPEGRYNGRPILMVGTNADPASRTAQVALDQLRRLGFEVNFRSVSQDTMYTAFCNVPRKRVHVCPNVGWVPDFNDGYAYLYATFNGNAIEEVNNTNWPQLDDPKINAAMDRAALIKDDDERAEAWGRIDHMITEQAPAVPWLWDKQANIASRNVQGVIAQWNASWDLSFTSIKR
jgi:peptide/nickel transport system substrate-binding protein